MTMFRDKDKIGKYKIYIKKQEWMTRKLHNGNRHGNKGFDKLAHEIL